MGVTRAKTVTSGNNRVEFVVGEEVEVGSREHPTAVQHAELSGDRLRGAGMVACDHRQAHACSPELADRLHRARAHAIGEPDETDELEAGDLPTVTEIVVVADRRLGHGQDPQPAPAEPVYMILQDTPTLDIERLTHIGATPSAGERNDDLGGALHGDPAVAIPTGSEHRVVAAPRLERDLIQTVPSTQAQPGLHSGSDARRARQLGRSRAEGTRPPRPWVSLRRAAARTSRPL